MAVNQSLTLTTLSQSTEDNSSKVRLLWQSVQTGGSYNMTTRTAYYYVSVNGAAETTNPVSYTLPYQSTVTLADVTVTVPHDTDGNGSITVRTWMNTNISAGVVELSKTLRLPQIPRASTVSAADGIIGSTSRIAVSKKSSGFTHSIAYSFGALSGFVGQDGGCRDTEVIFGQDSVDFLLPESFYDAIPDKPSGVCSLTVRTYSGSTQIGQAQTASFTVRTDASVCGPVVTGTVRDENGDTVSLTGDSGRLIRYHANALCTITATARKGASITEKRIAGVSVTGDSLTVSGAETGEIQFYARDSRGYESTVTVSAELIPYIRLTNNASVTRDDPTSGRATLILQGQVFDGSFGQEENGLQAFYQVNGGEAVPVTTTGSYYAAVPLTGMDYEKTYLITVTVRDKLETAVKSLTLPKGLPVFDWGEQDFAFHVPVKLDTPLSISSGGTGAVTADGAREALGAAPAGLTGEIVYAESKELLYEKLKQVYGSMNDYSSRFVVGIVNGVVYDIRLWRVNGIYGTVRIDSYSQSAELKRNILGGVWQAW